MNNLANWISDSHKYSEQFQNKELENLNYQGATHTGLMQPTGDGLYVGDFPANVNNVYTIPNTFQPNTYQPTITTTGTGIFGWPGPYTPPTKSLAEVLGDRASEFTIVPAAITVGCGKEKHTLADLLLKLDNVPFLELGAEIAVAPEVYNAIILYTKMGEEYAGMTLVDFLNQTLARK